MINFEKNLGYPFQGRNFFKNSETYFYADCSSPTYLEDYIEYRQAKILELTLLTQDNIIDKFFFTHQCETSLLISEISIDVNNGNTIKLDRFCVKFETRKKFYSNYDQTTLKPKSKKTNASFSAYVTFSECLCTAFEINKNLKYLSTLLKVNDAVCSVKIPFDFAERVKKVLELELSYVEKL